MINKSQALPPTMRFPRRASVPKPVKQECPPERQLVLDDGTKKCANCADCPRKVDQVSPQVAVEVDEVDVERLKLEVDFTNKQGL